MASSRRLRLVAVAALTLLILVFYYSNSSPGHHPGSSSSTSYLSTLRKVSHDEKIATEKTAQESKERMGRVKDAEVAAKKAAGEKAGLKPESPRVVGEVIDGGVRVAKGKGGTVEEGVKESVVEEGGKEEVAAPPSPPPKEPEQTYDPLEDIAEILKRSPIIIFSKTYCHYSRKAKDLLLKKYTITPAPFVVELDIHPHGAQLQTALGKQTGRVTVPNIMISGKSIGGADDILTMDEEGTLIEKIRSLGGKRVVGIARLKETS